MALVRDQARENPETEGIIVIRNADRIIFYKSWKLGKFGWLLRLKFVKSWRSTERGDGGLLTIYTSPDLTSDWFSAPRSDRS